MSKRPSMAIKKSILKNLIEHGALTYAELERKVNTGYRSIVLNCRELEQFGAISINKMKSHSANGKPYFKVSTTTTSRSILNNL